MWQFGLLLLCIAGANAGPAYASSGAGSYAGSGTGGGIYSSNYVGSGNYGPGFPYLGGFSYVGGGPTFGYVPFGFVDPLHFQNQLIGQFNAIQRQIANQASATHAISTKGASARAEASITPSRVQFDRPHLFNDQFQRQAEFWNKLQEQTGVQPGETVIVTNYPTKVVTADRVDTSSNKKKTSNTYAPLYSAYGGGYGGSYGASASGSVGPGGVYQSVSTSPGHTLSSRFGDAPTSTYYSSGTPGGFSGISTSSFSDSSGNRQASTTVNNNGKVTTYHTRN